MKLLIMIMLAVQIGIFLAAACAILLGRARAARPRPVWSSLAVSLVIVASSSWQIADGHAGQPGVDMLLFGAPFLLGMGVCCVLMLIRQWRGLDEKAAGV